MDGTLFYDGALSFGAPPDATLRDVVDTYNALPGVQAMTTAGAGRDARITAVGGLLEKSFGGPFEDAWMIRLNGEDAGGGLDAVRVGAGDDIVVYYGDPSLIQYPEIDLTRMITDGIVRFTSDDRTADGAGGAYVTKSPVAGATVVWDGMKYLTDLSGEIIIDSTGAGVRHTVSIERYYGNGLPTVLRFAPGYFVRYDYHDVPRDAWFYDAVVTASERHLLYGVSAVDFGPELPVNRAMFVTVLGRMADADVDELAAAGFTDTKDDGWSAGYIAWAAQSGIAGGRPDGTFGPYEALMREQLVVMLFRFADLEGFDTGGAGADLSAYADAGSVSDYARDAMTWAVGRGIVTGALGRLDPQGASSRAQVAVILGRFIQEYMPQ
jgi:hypothetical protein